MNYKDCFNLISKLEKLGFEPEISGGDQYFFDEPKFFISNTKFKISRQHTDGFVKLAHATGGGGASLVSPEESLYKSICEAMERFCFECYKKKNLLYEKFSGNKFNMVDPSLFSTSKNIKNRTIGWVKAEELLSQETQYIPAQLVYLNYKFRKDEILLDYPRNSNGSALGSSRDHALVNAINEAVERDSFMNIYLNKITPKKVNITAINSLLIAKTLSSLERYNIDINVLDITNDLGIPVFCTLLIDKTGLGPAVSVGAKAGLNTIDAILSSIAEAYMVRLSIKIMLKEGKLFSDYKGVQDRDFIKRAEYWFGSDMIEKLDFLLNAENSKKKYTNLGKTFTEELSHLKSIFSKSKREIFAVDIVIEEFKKIGFFSYKVLIPSLQPLYLREEEKLKAINNRRLIEVSNFYGKKFKGINQITHPFM